MPEDRPQRLPYPMSIPPEFLEEPEERGGGISPFALGTHLLRHAKILVGLPVLVAALAAAYAIASSDTRYVAESKFLAAKTEATAPDGGLMAQLNRLVGGGGGDNAVFYGSLIESTAFLRQAAKTEFTFTPTGENDPPPRTSGTLAEIFGLEPADERANVSASLSLLRPMVASRMDAGTGFIVVIVQTPWPELTVAVNERVLELVNAFNVEQRQTQAAAERRFVGDRMQAAEAELERAQAELLAFLERNQRYQQSPRLLVEYDRLRSAVQLKQNLYNSLAQSYEQARITEVRNTPVITVVERPADTVRPETSGSAGRNAFLAFLLTALIALGYVVVRAYLSRQTEEHPDDFEEFQRAARASVPPLPERIRHRLASLRGGNGDSPAVATGANSLPEHEPAERW